MRVSLVSSSAGTIVSAVALFHARRLSPTHPTMPMPNVEVTELLSRRPVAFASILGRARRMVRSADAVRMLWIRAVRQP